LVLTLSVLSNPLALSGGALVLTAAIVAISLIATAALIALYSSDDRAGFWGCFVTGVSTSFTLAAPLFPGVSSTVGLVFSALDALMLPLQTLACTL